MPDSPCRHHWLPTPADAASAMVLVGQTMCLRCRRIATADDMQAFGASIRRDESFGAVMRDYDVFKGT